MSYFMPKQHTRIALFHLKEAILDVLCQAKSEGKNCLDIWTIAETIGLEGEWNQKSNSTAQYQGITSIVINTLEKEGRIETTPRCILASVNITEEEYNKRTEATSKEYATESR